MKGEWTRERVEQQSDPQQRQTAREALEEPNSIWRLR